MELLQIDAIRLGSLLVPDPTACDVERCAITMALKATGALPENLNDCRSYHAGQWNTLAYPERTLRDAYPWIAGEFRCRWCALMLHGERVASHPFDYHVMGGRRIPLEGFCRWIEEIDGAVETGERCRAMST